MRDAPIVESRIPFNDTICHSKMSMNAEIATRYLRSLVFVDLNAKKTFHLHEHIYNEYVSFIESDGANCDINGISNLNYMVPVIGMVGMVLFTRDYLTLC